MKRFRKKTVREKNSQNQLYSETPFFVSPLGTFFQSTCILQSAFVTLLSQFSFDTCNHRHHEFGKWNSTLKGDNTIVEYKKAPQQSLVI